MVLNRTCWELFIELGGLVIILELWIHIWNLRIIILELWIHIWNLKIIILVSVWRYGARAIHQKQYNFFREFFCHVYKTIVKFSIISVINVTPSWNFQNLLSSISSIFCSKIGPTKYRAPICWKIPKKAMDVLFGVGSHQYWGAN